MIPSSLGPQLSEMDFLDYHRAYRPDHYGEGLLTLSLLQMLKVGDEMKKVGKLFSRIKGFLYLCG